ncbi:MAG TPA: DinB family protein [Dehalococcoidia bacterium]|jgi:hypothetical protein|nr:DinB family protein [Dehalococcoidia bacterium]
MAEPLAISIIDSLPAALRRLTADLVDEELRFRPAPGEWSIVEIVGHLIDKTEAWGGRFHRIATEDRPTLPAFDQDAYVRDRRYQDQHLDELLTRLSALLTAVAGELRSLPADAWERTGVHAERGVLTLGEAVRIYAVSLPEHVTQIVATRDAALSRTGVPPGAPTAR